MATRRMRSGPTERLLARYSDLLAKHGAQSWLAAGFLHRHSGNAEFVELARIAQQLKLALEKGRG